MLKYHYFSPKEPAADLLRELGERHEGGRLRIKAAWANLAGVGVLRDAVGDRLQQVEVVISGNNATTEVEAVVALRDLFSAEVRIVYEGERRLWHVKEWLFDGGAVGAEATLVVGSMNLTVGGLLRNTESALEYSGASHGGAISTALDEWQSRWDALTDDENPYCHDGSDDEVLEQLYRDGLLVSARKAARERRTRRAAETAKGSGPKSVPVLPAPTLQLPALPEINLPFSLDAEVEENDVPETPPGVLRDLTFDEIYVRTLTENDVAKLRRQQVGTLEPDIGEVPRDLNPTFWGWPAEYVTVTRKRTRDEWDTRARLITSKTGPDGEQIGLMIWHRKVREGHAAEHRFRPEAKMKDFVPDAFGLEGVLVVERVDEADVDFIVRLIAEDDERYADYSAVASQPQPAHRFGYARRSDLP